MKENNCLNCENFAFWDGDYCCLSNFTILCESNKNGDFTNDILHTLKTKDDCVDWKKNESDFHIKLYKEKYDKFLNLLDKI